MLKSANQNQLVVQEIFNQALQQTFRDVCQQTMDPILEQTFQLLPKIVARSLNQVFHAFSEADRVLQDALQKRLLQLLQESLQESSDKAFQNCFQQTVLPQKFREYLWQEFCHELPALQDPLPKALQEELQKNLQQKFWLSFKEPIRQGFLKGLQRREFQSALTGEFDRALQQMLQQALLKQGLQQNLQSGFKLESQESQDWLAILSLIRRLKLPEECVAELTALYKRLKAQDRPRWLIYLRLTQETLELIFAVHIQIRLDNWRLPQRNRPED